MIQADDPRAVGWDTWLLRAVAVALLTLTEARLLSLIHPNSPTLVDAARNVLNGTPDWMTYQNRLLGPLLAQSLSHALGGSFTRWYGVTTHLALLAANGVFFAALLRMTGRDKEAFATTGLFALFFLLLQDRHWLYVWDFYDLLIFTVFAYGIFTRKPAAYFVPVFLIELLNREAALFVSLWLILDAFSVAGEGRNGRRLRLESAPSLVAGLLLTALGIAWTWWVRHKFFHYSHLDIAQNAPYTPFGNLLMFSHNVVTLLHPGVQPGLAWDLLTFLIYPLLLVLLIRSHRYMTLTHWKAAVLIGGLLLSNILYAWVGEPRIYFPLIPLVLMFETDLSRTPSLGNVPSREEAAAPL